MTQKIETRKPFRSTCVGWPDDIRVLDLLISDGKEITRGEFLPLVSARAMKDFEKGLGYGAGGLKMADDYHVRYYVEPVSGVPYFVHSAIEHVFANESDIEGIAARIDPPRITEEDVSEWIESIIDDEGDENEHLHVMSGNGEVYDASEIIIITHPGDAFDEYGIFDALESAAAEIRAATRRGAGFIIVDRFSSSYMGPGEKCGGWDDWFDACREVSEGAARLYGDHLDDVAEHVAKYATSATSVLVTGLWSDEEHGCARALTDELAARGVPARLSEHSPDTSLRRDPDEPGP